MDKLEPSHKVYVLKRLGIDESTKSLSRDYAKELNPQQLEAVEVVNGPALVIAGAGSGKTRALVYRVARLIDLGIDPTAILLLTFTRKASQEMLGRVGLLIGPQSNQVMGGTFHSVANILLRRYGRSVGLESNFTILDRGDSEDLVNFVRTQIGLSETGKRFPRKRTIVDMFSKVANTLQSLDHVLLNEYSHFKDYLDDLVRLQQDYESIKRKRNLVDYDDLLLHLRELLTIDEQARKIISDTYRYILVDEYQDTNRLQAEVIRKLASTHDNVMVVGDDSQSIYAFRGATFRNIMEFPTLFPGTQILKLEENYRSTQSILDLANSIIEGAEEKYSKTLFTKNECGELPALVQAIEERSQSRFVVQKILELREEGMLLSDIAVLFRSSFHAFDLEVELSKRGIPFIKRGGVRFIETAHVKDLLAHLRIIHNPLDSISWHRSLLLIEGIGPKKSRDLIAQLMEGGRQFEVLRKGVGRSAIGLGNLASVLEDISGVQQESLQNQLNKMLEYYFPILKEHYDDYPKRIRDLEHLMVIAERYESLEDLLSDLTLDSPEQSIADIETEDCEDERLILSTIHSAKGLEWRSVFVIWLVDGRFPSSYSFLTKEELEEERRLLYVAVTRAKQHLYLTFPINVYDTVTGSVLSKPSRFLDEVSADLVNIWNVVDEENSSHFG